MSNLYIFPFLRNDTATSEIYTLSLHDALPISPILSSLAPVKDHVTAITNLELQNAYPGSHATSNSAFLSAAKAKLTESTDYYLGTTVDQIAAAHRDLRSTRVRSTDTERSCAVSSS